LGGEFMHEGTVALMALLYEVEVFLGLLDLSV
jgi:hypothetical protein